MLKKARGSGINQQVRNDIQVQWMHPLARWMKVNVDGSSLKSAKKESAGGVLRSDDSYWVKGFSRNLGDCSTIEVECWAILEGLKLSKRCGPEDLRWKQTPCKPEILCDRRQFHQR